MKMLYFHFKKLVICAMAVSLAAAPIGCSGQKKDIQHLFLVMAVGIDTMPDDRLLVTMQVLNPSSSPSQGGGGESGPTPKDVIVLSGIGDTFYDAIFDASKTMSRVQHFGHTKYIVMSESFARKGIGEFVDSLSRIEEVRLNTPILVTKGKASDIVKVQTPKSPVPSIVVENLFLRQQLIGFRPFSYLIDIINSLTSKSSATVAAVIEPAGLSEENKTDPDATFTLAGTAVFKKDKLAGYLNDKETRGMQWVKGTVQVGTVSFQSQEFGKVTCEVFKTSSKIKPVVNGDKVSVNVDIKVFSDLRGIGKSIDPAKNPEVLEEIALLQNNAIKNEVQQTLNMAKDDLGLDIYSFGEAVHRVYPKEWPKIEKDWPEIYQNLNVNIKVESIIRSAGLTNKSVK